ncbi:MAG: SusD/RagB family nutrient-binding outer membrane lipoprotein, partial [Sphingobacteriales bacterium]
MKLKKIIFTVLSTAVLASCNKITDKFDSSLDNPNSVPPSAASARLLLTNAELAFTGFFNGVSDLGMQTTRMIVMYGPKYTNAYSAQTYDGLWTTAYTSIFKSINTLLPIAEKESKFTDMGIAKILKAYTLMTLVDIFGDVPLSEANLGADNTNPKADKGSDVYAAAIGLLDAAIVDLGKTPSTYPGSDDLFYGAANTTGKNKWITLAKTLKLRAYLQTRLINPADSKTKIDELIAGGDLINSNSSAAGDFEFKYSSKLANPNSRHPRYNNNYNGNGSSTGEASDYMGNYFMWTLLAEKTETPGDRGRTSTVAGALDPRLRYYFYRQKSSILAFDEQSLSCIFQTAPVHYTFDMPFCYLNNGYNGRDHGDGSGIPPDGNLRTTIG